MAKQRFTDAEREWARRYQADPASAGPPPSSAPDPNRTVHQVDPQAGTPFATMPARDPRDRNAPRPVDPFMVNLMTGLNPVSLAGGAMDTLYGGRATRGVVSGHPRELLSMVPGSDAFGLTSPADEKASHLGFWGDMLANPGSAQLLGGLGRIGLAGLRGMVPRTAVQGLVPEAAQFVPRPPTVRSPQSGWFLSRTTPGGSPRLRPNGAPTSVANPSPPRASGPAALPAPRQQPQLENLDPVLAYERLTAGWRDPLAASAPRAVADPGRAVAQGARASKEFGRLSQASNRVPDRPMPTYQPPAEAIAAARDPNRVIGTERAAAESAIRAGIARSDNQVNSVGSMATRAMSNVGQAAQNAGSYLLNLLRGEGGGGRLPDTREAFIPRGRAGFPAAKTQEMAGDFRGGIEKVMQEMADQPRPPISNAGAYNSPADLIRRGSRMYKQNQAGEWRGVGGTHHEVAGRRGVRPQGEPREVERPDHARASPGGGTS
jgi:hypothetical protein